MAIADKSLFFPVKEGMSESANVERKYTIAAATVTMSKFGPSGSLKKKNIALEDTRAVMIKIIIEVFFDLKFIPVIILEN